MTLGSLFDGISGFPLAASWAGIETKWISEIDPYCLKVSKKNYPNAIQYGDIKEIHKPEPVDIISGGFPCQPFSVAGKQQGKEDNRYLWPEMLRIIREVKPRWVIGENVPGIINLALDEVLASLENEGYKTETFIIPACSVGAWHRRDRVWIIAYTNHSNEVRRSKENERESKKEWLQEWHKIQQPIFSDNVPNPNSERLQEQYEIGNSSEESERINKGGEPVGVHAKSGWKQWKVEPGVGRVANGIPHRVDRIKALGNAIVPQVAYEIFKAIVEIQKSKSLK